MGANEYGRGGPFLLPFAPHYFSSRTSGLFPFILKFLFVEKKIGPRADGLVMKSGSSARMNTLEMGASGNDCVVRKRWSAFFVDFRS